MVNQIEFLKFFLIDHTLFLRGQVSRLVLLMVRVQQRYLMVLKVLPLIAQIIFMYRIPITTPFVKLLHLVSLQP
jgi:hypothetical protein